MAPALLYRFTLIPRPLATVALAAGLVGLAGVTMPVLGYPLVVATLGVAGIGHLALTLWLIARGFAERQRPVPRRCSALSSHDRAPDRSPETSCARPMSSTSSPAACR